MPAPQTQYRLGLSLAVVTAFPLAWLSLGVGIIGKDGDPSNIMFLGVLAALIIGSLAVRFRARGMARVLVATALAQLLVAAVAVTAGWGEPWSGALELSLLNGIFMALFLGSAWLFRCAAQGVSEQRELSQ